VEDRTDLEPESAPEPSDAPQIELSGAALAEPRRFRAVPSGSDPGQFHVAFGRLDEGQYRAAVVGAPEDAEQPFRRADQQHHLTGAARSVTHVSSRRGISSARLQGRVRMSSWALSSSSQAVAQAPVDPGTQKT